MIVLMIVGIPVIDSESTPRDDSGWVSLLAGCGHEFGVKPFFDRQNASTPSNPAKSVAQQSIGVLMGEDRPADNQLIVLEDVAIQHHRNQIAEQPTRELVDLLTRDGANRGQRVRPILCMVEDPCLEIAFGALRFGDRTGV
jgi:hypothetical protein